MNLLNSVLQKRDFLKAFNGEDHEKEVNMARHDVVYITREGVPYYLREGGLFLSFDVSSDTTGTFSVPTECFKETDELNTFDDMLFLLRTLRFWIVKKAPESLIKLILSSSNTSVISFLIKCNMDLLSDFIRDLPFLSVLLTMGEKCVEGRSRAQMLCDQMYIAVSQKAPCEVVNFLCSQQEDISGASVAFLELKTEPPSSLLFVKAVHWARQNKVSWSHFHLRSMARNGHFKVLRLLKQHARRFGIAICNGAAEGGHLDILQWGRQAVTDQRAKWSGRTVCNLAARNGHFELLKWARLSTGGNAQWDAETVCSEAAAGGHLDILQWLLSAEGGNADWEDGISACTSAAENGRLEVLQWAWSPTGGNASWDEKDVCYGAVLSGSLPLLQWLRSPEGGNVTSWRSMDICAVAVRTGNLEMLQWLRSGEGGKARWTHLDICASAIEYGHIHVLQWLISPRGGKVSWQEETICTLAAKHGQLDMLQWLRTKGGKRGKQACWNETSVCTAAAENGHLDLLKWVRSEDGGLANWDESAVASGALAGGHLAILQWMYSPEGGSVRWDGVSACDTAVQNGYLNVLQWLRSPDGGNANWNRENVCATSIRNGHLAILQWLQSEECGEEKVEWKEKKDVCNGLFQRRLFRVLNWMVHPDGGNCQWRVSDFIQIAAEESGLPMKRSIVWMSENMDRSIL